MHFKKLTALALTLMISITLLTGCAKDQANDGIKTMVGSEVVENNSDKQKDKVLIIDVRSPEEYQAGHIANAININIDGFEDNIGMLEDLKEFPIIAYCNSGKKSGQAAEILLKNGFTDVTNADGVKQFEYELVHYTDLRGAQFQEFINNNDDIVLVDVRPAKQASETGMIAGAINIPYDEIEANLDKLPKDKTIALYCNTGTKSAENAKQLEALGYTNVVNAIDGVKEYSYELVK